MKETDRLPDPSIANCIDTTYQYNLQQPRTYTYTGSAILSLGGTCTAAYPDEWNR